MLRSGAFVACFDGRATVAGIARYGGPCPSYPEGCAVENVLVSEVVPVESGPGLVAGSSVSS